MVYVVYIFNEITMWYDNEKQIERTLLKKKGILTFMRVMSSERIINWEELSIDDDVDNVYECKEKRWSMYLRYE